MISKTKKGFNMDKLIQQQLKDDIEIYEKYKKAEEKYYKKLGKYETLQIDIELDEEIFKNFILSLAKNSICFDDFVLSLLKVEIIKKEMEKTI